MDVPEQSTAKITIYDVARIAEVSPSTVSRAFSRPGRVSAKTAERIHRIAKEMGYQSPNEPRLAPTTSQIIGVALADITNPFFFSIIRGAQNAAISHGYSVTVLDGTENESVEKLLLERSIPSLAGLVIAATRLSDGELKAMTRSIPTIALNRPVPGIPSIVPDNARGMRSVLEHLAQLGHRKIAYLSGPTRSWADSIRWKTFQASCYQLEVEDLRIATPTPTVRGGEIAFPQAMESGATAIVGYNDLISIGVMRAAKRAGVSIPHQLSVIGFDNTFTSDLVTPKLTTVAAPLGLLGERAVNAIMAVIKEGENQVPSVDGKELPMELLIRETTAPAPIDRSARGRR